MHFVMYVICSVGGDVTAYATCVTYSTMANMVNMEARIGSVRMLLSEFLNVKNV